MQRLEVTGAVRPIYGSLGVKRLRELDSSPLSKNTVGIRISKFLTATSKLSCGNTTFTLYCTSTISNKLPQLNFKLTQFLNIATKCTSLFLKHFFYHISPTCFGVLYTPSSGRAPYC